MQSTNNEAAVHCILSSSSTTSDPTGSSPTPPPTAAVVPGPQLSPHPLSLRALLSVPPQLPVWLLLLSDTNGAPTTTTTGRPPPPPTEFVPEGDRMVGLLTILDEALDICNDVESIFMMSGQEGSFIDGDDEDEDTTTTNTVKTDEKQ